MEENRPGGELIVVGYPLEPGQSTIIRIKGGSGQAFMVRGVVIFKEVVNFEYPTQWVKAIKVRHVKLHMVRLCGR